MYLLLGTGNTLFSLYGNNNSVTVWQRTCAMAGAKSHPTILTLWHIIIMISSIAIIITM